MDISIQVVPHDPLAEKYVVGYGLIHGRLHQDVKPEHFWSGACLEVFKAMCELKVSGKLEDDTLVNVANHLRGKQVMNEIGGISFLNECMGTVTNEGLLDFHVGTLKRMHYRREAIRFAEKVSVLAHDLKADEHKLKELINSGMGK